MCRSELCRIKKDRANALGPSVLLFSLLHCILLVRLWLGKGKQMRKDLPYSGTWLWLFLHFNCSSSPRGIYWPNGCPLLFYFHRILPHRPFSSALLHLLIISLGTWFNKDASPSQSLDHLLELTTLFVCCVTFLQFVVLKCKRVLIKSNIYLQRRDYSPSHKSQTDQVKVREVSERHWIISGLAFFRPFPYFYVCDTHTHASNESKLIIRGQYDWSKFLTF